MFDSKINRGTLVTQIQCLDENFKADSESKRASLQQRVCLNNEIFSTPVLNTQYSWEEKKKLGEQNFSIQKVIYWM